MCACFLLNGCALVINDEHKFQFEYAQHSKAKCRYVSKTKD